MLQKSDKRTDLMSEFEGVVRQVLMLRRFTDSEISRVWEAIPKKRCGDQYVGSIKDWDCDADDFPVRKFIHDCQPRRADAILFILESPHTEEYKNGACAPAKKNTGRALRKYKDKIAKLSGVTDVYLVNAVRYQCSLGKAYKDIRKLGWFCEKTLPLKEIKEEIVCGCLSRRSFIEDFCIGIEQVLDLVEGKINVINACTKGGCGKYYNMITNRILEIKHKREDKNIDVYKTTHPSSWFKSPNFDHVLGGVK